MKYYYVIGIILTGLILGLFLIHHEKGNPTEQLENKIDAKSGQAEIEKDKIHENEKLNKNALYSFIGENKNKVLKAYGEPDRIDPSKYDYNWLIYDKNPSQYFQVGILNDIVVSIYVLGKDLDIAPFFIGQKRDELAKVFSIEKEIPLHVKDNFYQFELNDTDFKTVPLIKFQGIYAQVYFDSFTGKISSIRFSNGESLIKQHPYKLVYRGDLIKAASITAEEQKEIEERMEKQIFEITNILRRRYHLSPVKWDEGVSKVAHAHSKDMAENQYFSHDSPENGDLLQRLKEEDIFFTLAGENIAAQYTDSIAVVAGWLNSEGHRKTMLNEEFSHLGVGVYDDYYTQNFIKKINQ